MVRRLLCNEQSGKSVAPSAASGVGLPGKIQILRRHAEELYIK